MEGEHRAKVLEVILGLEGWADFLCAALHADGRGVPGKGESLKDVIDERSLKRVREIAWSLRDELHRISTELSLSGAPEKTTV
jgi:hypothetical protein